MENMGRMSPVHFSQSQSVDRRIHGAAAMSTVSFGTIVDNVEAAVGFYTTPPRVRLLTSTFPAFADVTRRSAVAASGRRVPPPYLPDGRRPVPGGWNRIHLIVDDLAGEVEDCKKPACRFRSEIRDRTGRFASVLDDPAGNPVELFQPATNQRLRPNTLPGDLIPSESTTNARSRRIARSRDVGQNRCRRPTGRCRSSTIHSFRTSPGAP